MTNRDIMVLNFINLVGICRTKHIRQLYFKGLTDTVWNRRARFLEEYGELKRFRTPIFEREYIYYSNRKPNQRILRHDLYITDLVTALMDLGITDIQLERNVVIGDIISDGFIIIRYKKNGRVFKRAFFIEVQLSGKLSDCMDKYNYNIEALKEFALERDLQVMPRILLISDMNEKIRVRLQYIQLDCLLSNIEKCIE